MTQFDPQMVAQMLMQPIQRASENLGGGPFGIGADAGGSFFVDPEVAARTGYGTAVTGTSFFPGAGIVDAYGGAVDITGQPLPSFSENIREGQFTDAGLQALGVAGDIATIAAPLTLGTSALLGAMMKAPGAARKISKATDVASDVGSIAKVEPPTETQPGIIAFHGSGADFDEFKLDKIGTGEGAQAFGYGLYFTDSEDIAKFYKNQVSFQDQLRGKLGLEYKGEKFVDLGDTAAAESASAEYKVLSKLQEDIASYLPANPKLATPEESKKRLLKRLDSEIERYSKAGQEGSDVGTIDLGDGSSLEDLLVDSFQMEKDALLKINADDIKIQTGKTYKVALEPKPEELLDYDLSLKEQPEKFKKILKPLYEKYSVSEAADFGTLLESVKSMRTIPDDAFMEELSNKGIKGIKYKSGQLSGITDSEATNFVIFDDKLIKILEKYGIVGPVAVSATAAALRDDDGST
jgi:hypothetical protein